MSTYGASERDAAFFAGAAAKPPVPGTTAGDAKVHGGGAHATLYFDDDRPKPIP
jgi:hypothetical protein